MMNSAITLMMEGRRGELTREDSVYEQAFTHMPSSLHKVHKKVDHYTYVYVYAAQINPTRGDTTNPRRGTTRTLDDLPYAEKSRSKVCTNFLSYFYLHKVPRHWREDKGTR